MSVKTINVPMIARDACLMPGNEAEAHRYTWFYNPEVFGDIEVNNIVEFRCCGLLIARGLVTSPAHRDAHPKFCSAVNYRGFYWIDADESST